MKRTRPYLGWGFAGLSRELNERLSAVENTVDRASTALQPGDKIPAADVEVPQGLYEGTDLASVLEEIANRLEALENPGG